MPVFCITLCTAERPNMLRDCLGSIARQTIPVGWQVHVVVVENHSVELCREIVSETMANTGISYSYVLEAERGIPFARNTSVVAALGVGADWIAFVDDDEKLDDGWLETMIRHAESDAGDVYTGPVIALLPDETPHWVSLTLKSEERQMLNPLVTAATNNTIAARRIFSDDGLGLRFDPSFRFTGGSDTELFNRAVRQGCTIVAAKDAIVRETVPASRLTLRWYMQRAYRVAANNVTISYKHLGTPQTLLRFVRKVPGRLLLALFINAPLALLTVFNRELSTQHGLRALKNLARGAGAAAGLARRNVEPYKVIDGH